jgi:nucleoside-diphosphate-sugar epimerase
MRVFVAGANGAVGKRLVPLLVANGHQVTGTTTTDRSTDAIRAMGAEPVVVDGLDAAGIGEAVARAEPDAIIHEMTALSGTPDFRHFDRWFALTNRLRTEGTEHLLAAAKASGVKRFVAQSFTGWSNSREGSWIKTEEDPLDPHPVKEQTETLAAIRFLERAVLDAPLDGIVVRYGGLYGPGSSETLAGILRKRMFPVIGNGAGIVSSTHIDDAAGGTLAALEHGRRGIYNIVDDAPAPSRVVIPAIAEALGAKPPLHIPAWLGRLLAGNVAVTMMTEGRGSSNATAKRELGWQPIWPSWRDGFRHGLDTPVPLAKRAATAAKETTAATPQPRSTTTSPRPMATSARYCSRSPIGCSGPSARRRTSSRRRSSGTGARSPRTRPSSRRRRTCRPSSPAWRSTSSSRPGFGARRTSASGCRSRS